MTAAKATLGGWSAEASVTEEVMNIGIQVKPDIEKMTGVHFDFYIPKTYRYQIVAGTNYLVKVKVSEKDKYLQAMIFQALPGDGGKLTVTGVQYPKIISDPLEPFKHV